MILLLPVQSCNDKERSEIEIIKYDKNIVKEIVSSYDSTYIENKHREDFWTIEHYLIDSSKENLIFRDSLKNVVGIVKRENGKNYYTAEYFPNGQLMGKIAYSFPGIIDGPATYYYEDGRIRSKGEWKEFKRIGEWKNFGSEGYLKSIEYYSDKGELIKEKKME